MATKYPNSIDTNTEIPLSTDAVTKVDAVVTNTLRGAVLAIESELGADPSREYGTVRTRLDALQNQITALAALSGETITVGGDLSGTLPNPNVIDLTITGEQQGSVLYFNGSHWVQLAPGTNGKVLTTQGAGANPAWTTVSGGGSGGRVLSGILFIDSTFVGSSTGSLEAPYTTLTAAIAGAVSASYTNCQFVIAPGVYSDSPTISGAVKYSFGPAVVGSNDGSFPGVRVCELSGTLSWTVTDGAMVSFTGFTFDHAIKVKDDLAAGTGNANLILTGCYCEGVNKDQVGSYSHSINMSMVGRKPVNQIGSAIIVYVDSHLHSTVTISGYFSAQNSILAQQIAGAAGVVIDSCFIQGGSISCGDASEVTNSIFESNSTLASNNSGVVYMDKKSHYWYVNTSGNSQTGTSASITVYA